MSSRRAEWARLQESLNAVGPYAEDLLTQNDQLLARIEELSSELSVWRRAERQTRQEKDDMEKRLATVSASQEKTIISVVLDGDGAIFLPKLLVQGRDGGREAASLLRKGIIDHARQRIGRDPDAIIVAVFVNVAGLTQALVDNNIVDAQRFADFILGFNASAPLFSLIDCGRGKEGADAKMRGHIRLYAALPTCSAIYAAISHDGGYATTLGVLRTEGLLDKFVLIKSYAEVAHELKFFDLPSLELPDVFIKNKLVTSWKQAVSNKQTKVEPTASAPATPKPAQPLLAKPTNGSYTPVVVKGVPIKEKSKLKKVDPRIPLHQNDPAPCNRFYLSPDGCKKPGCPYSHEYDLSPDQLSTLSQDAKKSPCYYTMRDMECPEMARYGTCLMGHVCPRGADCPYGDRCRFSKPGMHPRTAPTPVVTAAKREKVITAPIKKKSAPPPPLSSSPSDQWTSESDDDILLEVTTPRTFSYTHRK